MIDASVKEGHRGPSPELTAALKGWPGPYYWSSGDGPGRLVLILPTAAQRRERWWLFITLFLLTFATVAAGGSLLERGEQVSVALVWNFSGILTFARNWVLAILPGFNFALALMGILLVHECGHYFTARRYRISVSPPFFIPAPYQINFIGTFGALIRLRGSVADRRQLLDVGAAGPWAGFVVAALYFVVGLLHSTPIPGNGGSGLVLAVGGSHFSLGDCLLTHWIRDGFFHGQTVALSPLAFAGWLGILVTALNLLPIGQLDGGHILYALLGRSQRFISITALIALIPLGRLFKGWWAWEALIILFILIFSRGRMLHPPVLDRHRRLPVSRLVLGWVTVALFVLTFTPVPIYI